MLVYLQQLGLPAALSAALTVFFLLYGLTARPALKAHLARASTRKSWQHFRLVVAYVAISLTVALLVGLAVWLTQLVRP